MTDATDRASVYREALRHLPELRELASQGTPVVEHAGIAVSFVDLEAAVAKLSPRKRQAVELIVIGDMLQREAAAIMQIATATAAQYVQAACLQIARDLDGETAVA